MRDELKNKIVGYVRTHKKGLLLLVLVVFVGTMLLRGVMQEPAKRSQRAEIASLNNQIEYETERQKEVENLKDKVDSDDYIRKIATERLGLIPSNAKIFVDVSGE